MDLRKLSAVNVGAYGAALAVMAAWPSSSVLVGASLVFGQRSFGTVFGLVGAAPQAGAALGPGLMGLLPDALGS